MSEQCTGCLYLTLPMRGQKRPECLFKSDPAKCKGPFRPTPDRLRKLGKMLQEVCGEINAKIN